jgi:hypothetical protein
MPQIDNVTFLPQVLDAFFMLVTFFSLVLKTHGLLLASIFKIRLKLINLIFTEPLFTPFIKYLQNKYFFEYSLFFKVLVATNLVFLRFI